MKSNIQGIDFNDRFGYEYKHGVKPQVFTKLKEGSLFSYKTLGSNIWYCECVGFYKINGGAVGIHYHHLDGSGSGSTPESFMQDVKIFPSLQEMKDEVDKNKT